MGNSDLIERIQDVLDGEESQDVFIALSAVIACLFVDADMNKEECEIGIDILARASKEVSRHMIDKTSSSLN